MTEKSFGITEINLIGDSVTPTIESPNNLDIKAINVAISTDLSVGHDISTKNISGIGVSFGFERIYLVMDQLGLFPANLISSIKVLFVNFGDSAAEVAYSYLIKLRDKKISCELYPIEAKLNKQLAYANSKGIKKVVLIGSNEIKEKVFELKDMDSGSQTKYPLSKLTDLF